MKLKYYSIIFSLALVIVGCGEQFQGEYVGQARVSNRSGNCVGSSSEPFDLTLNMRRSGDSATLQILEFKANSIAGINAANFLRGNSFDIEIRNEDDFESSNFEVPISESDQNRLRRNVSEDVSDQELEAAATATVSVSGLLSTDRERIDALQIFISRFIGDENGDLRECAIEVISTNDGLSLVK